MVSSKPAPGERRETKGFFHILDKGLEKWWWRGRIEILGWAANDAWLPRLYGLCKVLRQDTCQNPILLSQFCLLPSSEEKGWPAFKSDRKTQERPWQIPTCAKSRFQNSAPNGPSLMVFQCCRPTFSWIYDRQNIWKIDRNVIFVCHGFGQVCGLLPTIVFASLPHTWMDGCIKANLLELFVSAKLLTRST